MKTTQTGDALDIQNSGNCKVKLGGREGAEKEARELKTVSSAEKNEAVEKAENVIEPETPAEDGLVEGQSEENTPTKVEE